MNGRASEYGTLIIDFSIVNRMGMLIVYLNSLQVEWKLGDY